MTTMENLLGLLPDGWEKACFDFHAIERKRKIRNPKDLMQLCLIYLLQDVSLLQISEMANLLDIADLSDVAFMKRFASCNDWFEEIIKNLSPKPILSYPKSEFLSNYRVLAVDGSDIMEKGAAPKEWHLHYALDLFRLTTNQVAISDGKTGESLKNFRVEPGDLMIGDRAYGTKTSMKYCKEHGGDFIFRMKNRAFNFYNDSGKKMNLCEELSRAEKNQPIAIKGYVTYPKKERLEIRICAIKLSEEAIRREQKKIQRRNSKRQFTLSQESVFTHSYMFVVTSLPETIPAEDVLKLYQLRWQVELVFKRLKSILGIGNLPHKSKKGIKAWLNGKVMVALLLEKEMGEINCFP